MAGMGATQEYRRRHVRPKAGRSARPLDRAPKPCGTASYCGRIHPLRNPLRCPQCEGRNGEAEVPGGRVTLGEAATMLGVSEGAVRKRVGRGTVCSQIGTGRRCIWLEQRFWRRSFRA
jgi:hypothetical protein